MGCSKAQLYKLIRDGKFPRPRPVSSGGRWTEEDWSAYLLLAGRWQPGAFREKPPRTAGKKPPDQAK